MILNTLENIKKAQDSVSKMNGKLISEYIKKKGQRHVKEENEPMMDTFIDSFQDKYASEVVGNTMKDIINYIKNV